MANIIYPGLRQVHCRFECIPLPTDHKSNIKVLNSNSGVLFQSGRNSSIKPLTGYNYTFMNSTFVTDNKGAPCPIPSRMVILKTKECNRYNFESHACSSFRKSVKWAGLTITGKKIQSFLHSYAMILTAQLCAA